MKPFRVKNVMVMVAQAAEKRRFANSRMSIIGCGVRSSRATSSASSAAAPAKPSRVGAASQPRLGASMML
ncbi:Uncharacterised protein [Mycobacteroides abscessus subsp. abscessus]|nr:Uncharacterised protein [Mycobacteroides abscessus subsp. abscessus]